MAPILPNLLLLLLLLPVSSASAAGFWTINCGTSQDLNGGNIRWLGDGDYVRSGESYEIRDGRYNNQFKTLRAFPKNKKNCYTVPVGKDRRVEVTVAFYYGNYDGKEKIPSFELMFDGTDWTKVSLEEEAQVGYTAMYVTKTNSTDVCLGRIYEDQDPFVSAIQVIEFDRGMYPGLNASFALWNPARFAFGANNAFGYPNDQYNRNWNPLGNFSNMISDHAIVESNASTISIRSSIDNPPAILFNNATAPTHGLDNLTIETSFLTPLPRPVYMNMYFSEMSNLTGSEDKRSFHIYLDDDVISNASRPIIPPFGDALEFTTIILQATSKTNLTLVPTTDSDLPPIISGLEAFNIIGFSQQRTNFADVATLKILQDNFKVLQNWTGDPCLPSGFKWEWVDCSSDESPRILSLSLGGYGLKGSLPDFSNLNTLVVIDLHNNGLTGSIPKFIAELPNLRLLNLAYNNFNSIPPSIISNERIFLNISGNPLLEQRSASSPGSSVNGSSQAPPPPPPGNGCNKTNGSLMIMYMLMLLILVIS